MLYAATEEGVTVRVTAERAADHFKGFPFTGPAARHYFTAT